MNQLQTVGERVFGGSGVLAAQFPGYEPRPSQMQMADLCASTIAEAAKGKAVIEAGTGTGKSYAYLVPAIESGERVVVSTEGLALQAQLVEKDLPNLERMLGREIKYAIAMGRSNYLCERNTMALVQEGQQQLPGDLYGQSQLITAEQLIKARYDGWDGRKATNPVECNEATWGDFAGDDSCSGARCEYAEKCPYLAAKEAYSEADIIITNHHFYLLHHYVSERSGGTVALLPEHRFWVADEAHTLGDIAQNVFGVELRQGAPKRFVTKLLKQLKALKLELPGVQWDVPGVERAAEKFFGTFRQATKDEQLWEEFPAEILAEAEARMGALVDTLLPIRTGLHRAGATADEDQKRTLDALKRNADQLIDGLRGFFTPATVHCPVCLAADGVDVFCDHCDGSGRSPHPDPPVQYVAVEQPRGRDRDGHKHVTLHSKPIETAPIFRRIYEDLSAVILTSATLTVGGSFSSITAELGIGAFDCETLVAASPFDYATQCRGYLPRSIPKRSQSEEYYDALAGEVLKLTDYTGGRAFVLFTATKDMHEIRTRLELTTPYPVLTQGDAPKEQLIEQFKERASILLGVRSFWTGVDIPGEALSCVALVAFPFPFHLAPLVEATCKRIDARHGSKASFMRYMLPRAEMAMKQGAGRLIRHASDRGILAVLDERAHTKKYGRLLVARLLPGIKWSDELPTDWSLNDGVHAQRAEDARGEGSAQPAAGDVGSGAAGRPLVEGVGSHRGGDVVGAGCLVTEVDRASELLDLWGGELAGGPPGSRSRSLGVAGADQAGAQQERGGLVELPREVGEARGVPGGSDRRGGAPSAGNTPSQKWRYLLDLAAGNGPIRSRLTLQDQETCCEWWEKLSTRYRRHRERLEWWLAYPDAPEAEQVGTAADKALSLYAGLLEGLTHWAGEQPELWPEAVEGWWERVSQRQERVA